MGSQGQKFLGNFEVFLDQNKKDQGKEGQGFCVFQFFGVSGSVGALPGHNLSTPRSTSGDFMCRTSVAGS